MIAKATTGSSTSLANLAKIITKFPQIILNMPATPEQKENLKSLDSAKNLLLDFSKKLESVSGRLLVRPSGTENLIRITMWGNNEAAITALASELKEKLEETL